MIHDHQWHYDIHRHIRVCLCGETRTDEELCSGIVSTEAIKQKALEFDRGSLQQWLMYQEPRFLYSSDGASGWFMKKLHAFARMRKEAHAELERLRAEVRSQ